MPLVAGNLFRGKIDADGTEFFSKFHSQGKPHITQSDNGNCFHLFSLCMN